MKYLIIAILLIGCSVDKGTQITSPSREVDEIICTEEYVIIVGDIQLSKGDTLYMIESAEGQYYNDDYFLANIVNGKCTISSHQWPYTKGQRIVDCE